VSTLNFYMDGENYLFKNKRDGLEIHHSSNYYNVDRVKEKFLNSMIDMDDWKHSWHIKGTIYNVEKRNEYRKIILDKIEIRKLQLENLNFALKIIGKKPKREWEYIKDTGDKE